MCAVPLPFADKAAGDTPKRRLWDDYQIEVPIVDWPERQLLRVSIQAYNTPADVDRLLDALARLL